MRISAAIFVLIIFTCAALAGDAKVPVMYGQEAELDACTSQGVVQKLDTKGDNFLALRAGPGANYKMLAKLKSGQKVAMCDSKPGWLGVVVFPTADDQCGTNTSLDKPAPYSGPCQSGWVAEKYILQVSG